MKVNLMNLFLSCGWRLANEKISSSGCSNSGADSCWFMLTHFNGRPDIHLESPRKALRNIRRHFHLLCLYMWDCFLYFGESYCILESSLSLGIRFRIPVRPFSLLPLEDGSFVFVPWSLVRRSNREIFSHGCIVRGTFLSFLAEKKLKDLFLFS